MIGSHTIKALEFEKIVSRVAGFCLTPFGREEVEAICPMYDRRLIEKRLNEVTQLRGIIEFGLSFPLVRMEDCRKLLERSNIEGTFLDPDAFLVIDELARISIELNKYDKENRDNWPDIDQYLKEVRAFPELRQEISRAIDLKGEIKDSASPGLKKIRAELIDAKRKITSRLQTILAGRRKQPGWQDDVVTSRNGRYVIPVPSSQFHGDMGILHDRSQSGATLFVEPSETVETNNRINLLFQQERIEINRILKALTSEVAERSEPLLRNCRLIGILDRIHASAGFSIKIDGHQPTIADEAIFDLKEARHPLLITQFGGTENVIPTTLSLDSDRQALLITGPNTGGKTITLKTVGLAIIMAQSGLHISASEFSTVGIFNHMFADIGDEQSIELSLSTFSSHITNIIDGLSSADHSTLLLFDEIGAGTDPKEGAGLAEAIVLHAVASGARIIASTHYSQLKTLATEHAQIENASLEFDRESLAPTYRLQLGIPGSSYAIEIARRLGLPDSICDHASSLVGSGEKSLNSLISSLEEELLQIRLDRANLTERLAKTEELENFYRTESERLKTDIEDEKKKGLADTEAFLDSTRKEIEKLVSDIRSSAASDESVKNFHHSLKYSLAETKAKRRKLADKDIVHDKFEVNDPVAIISLNAEGIIEQLIGSEKVRVRVGSIATIVDIRNLRKLANQSPTTAKKKPQKVMVETVESPEIHLRGMTGEEAIEALERYLDRAVVAGLRQVYVVHGKGTGALRRVLSDYLKSHSEVESIRLGDWSEGGAGVTIVHLKG